MMPVDGVWKVVKPLVTSCTSIYPRCPCAQPLRATKAQPRMHTRSLKAGGRRAARTHTYIAGQALQVLT